MAKPSDGLGLLVAAAPAEDEEASGHDEAKQLAAEGVLKAIKRGDAAALSRALEEHYECCTGDYEDEPEEDAELDDEEG